MPDPNGVVIGEKIWPLFDYLDTHFRPVDGKALTFEEALALLPKMERAIELIDAALTETGTANYPREQLLQQKSRMVHALSKGSPFDSA